jgi:acyl carrier protein
MGAQGPGAGRPADCDVLSIVLGALATHAGIDPQKIDVDTRLSAIPGIESVQALRAITEVEDACGVLVPDDFLFEAATVRQFCDRVLELRQGAAAGTSL